MSTTVQVHDSRCQRINVWTWLAIIEDHMKLSVCCKLAIAEVKTEIQRLNEKISELAEYQCEHRCGTCDNGMTCGVHDCEANPLHSVEQYCSACAGCKSPQDDKHGGPCDPCTCIPAKAEPKKLNKFRTYIDKNSELMVDRE